MLDSYIVMIHEIECFLFVKIWLAYPLLLVVLCLIFLSVMIVSWHGSKWCCRWIFGRSSRLKDVIRISIIFWKTYIWYCKYVL